METPLARLPEASARLHGFLDQALQRVVHDAPDAVAVDLVGSLARGEGTVLPLEERSLVLSDIDLAVVLPNPEGRRRAAPVLARASRELAASFGAHDFLGAVDIGAYAVRDLPLQAARPGTLEWARSGVTLAGDGNCRTQLPVPLPSAIPLEEALLLLENRLLELLSVHPDCHDPGPRAWAAAYAGGKGVLDAALARLLAAGECPSGVVERARAYAVRARNEPQLPSTESVSFWTTFKTEPNAQRVARRYDRSPAASGWAAGAWQEGARALLAVYREIVSEHGPAADDTWLAQAAGRARLRRRVRRAIDAWREAGSRRLAWGRLRNVPGFARVGAPEHLLGATAAVLVAEASGGDGTAVLPPAAYDLAGFIDAPGTASWEERRQQAVRAWDRWVLRGARTAETDT